MSFRLPLAFQFTLPLLVGKFEVGVLKKACLQPGQFTVPKGA